MIPDLRPRGPSVCLPPLPRAALRPSPTYRLVAHEALPPAEREAFSTLASTPDHFGLLVPTDRVERGVKAVDRAMASLLDGLAGRGPVPPCDDATLASLVLDGVLELAEDGLSGPAACEALGLRDLAPGDSRLATLSLDALRLAHALPDAPPAAVASWLYRYGTLPDTGGVALEPEAHLSRLGLPPRGALRERLEEACAHHLAGAWASWQRTDRGTAHLPLKLYVSPRPEDLRDVVPALVEHLCSEQVPAFKLGLGRAGLHRPDKIVAYLPSWERLRDVASGLAQVLSGARPHGVPFTAPLTPDGLLSWGMDPPADGPWAGWGPAESWRLWLANHAARSLALARGTGADADQAVRFVLARLALAGIDGTTWTPRHAPWED